MGSKGHLTCNESTGILRWRAIDCMSLFVLVNLSTRVSDKYGKEEGVLIYRITTVCRLPREDWGP